MPVTDPGSVERAMCCKSVQVRRKELYENMNRRTFFALAILVAVTVSASLQSFVAEAQGPGGGNQGSYFSDPNATDNHCGYTDETTSGPYYIAGAPETENLNYQNLAGEPLTISGVVYDGTTGKPIANAEVDVWHADASGNYWPAANGDAANFDKSKLNLRGVVYTNDKGEYTFTTIKPAIYEGRRRHIHYYITAEGYIPLFTQTYWPNDPNISRDGTDANTESCRYLTFVDAKDGGTAGTFDIYLRPQSGSATAAATQAATPVATAAATAAATVAAQPFTLFNLNTATSDQLLTIPNMNARMVREYMEYRPYISIAQFRKEIGKYVGAGQVAEWEKYVYVPIQVDASDAATLKQIPGVDDKAASALIAARPLSSNGAFLAKLATYLSADQVALAENYLEAE
jgi:protocatechuate 3,4-dioxygenase beta subunit